MSLDFPRAWQIAKNAKKAQHDKLCSFRQTGGAILCDCPVITQHPEYLSETFYGKDGKPFEDKGK